MARPWFIDRQEAQVKFMEILLIIMAALFGAAAGIFIAVRRVRRGGLGAQIVNGQWATTTLAGSTSADALTRARIAIGGLLALDKREAIYFNATHDDKGEPLRSDRSYEIRGRVPEVRWWSITAYGADHFLIENQAGIYSIQPDTAARGADGGIVARLSAKPGGNAWLPSGREEDGGKRLALTLRLYNAPDAVMDNLAAVELPRIVRVG
jgi:hypothetical protein